MCAYLDKEGENIIFKEEHRGSKNTPIAIIIEVRYFFFPFCNGSWAPFVFKFGADFFEFSTWNLESKF